MRASLPTDPNLLVSAGKDNNTFLWDLKARKPTYTLPGVESSSGAESFDFLAGAGAKRFSVRWSPNLPGMLCACSFSRRVQFFNLSAASQSYAPKWLRPSVGVAHGFGGKLVSFNPSGRPAKVTLSSVASDPQLAARARAFEAALDSQDFGGFCAQKVNKKGGW